MRRSAAGLTGRGAKPPPQLGQTLPSTSSAQRTQNVHSKLQIRASALAGGRSASQCSQLGNYPATTARKHRPADLAAHAALLRQLRDVPARER